MQTEPADDCIQMLLAHVFGITLPDWDQALDECLREMEQEMGQD